MSVHAAVTGDLELLKLAMLHDPLVGAVCSPEEVWADGRRDGRRPEARMAAAIRPCEVAASPGRGLQHPEGEDARLARLGAAQKSRDVDALRAEKARTKV